MSLGGTMNDGNAWTQLRENVRRFVARRVRDPHIADDITQDVMLKVQANLATLPAGERLDAWVLTVARNAVTDHYRSRRPSPGLPDAAQLPAAEGEVTADKELSACITNMIARLPAPYAEALRITEIEQLSQQELADRAGISLSGAKSRVQRAREKLHGMLLDCCDIERSRTGGIADFQTTPRSSRYCGGDEGGRSESCG